MLIIRPNIRNKIIIFALQLKFNLMKKIVKLFLLSSVLILTFSSCEKGCICRNLDTGASEELFGVYSKKDCESYTEYYQTVSKADNVECHMEWR